MIQINDLYNLIMDENDNGNEVVALVIDYNKRIRHAERANDKKAELNNISNDLKEVAEYFNIPVITSQQLNISSASVVDTSLQNKKEDMIKVRSMNRGKIKKVTFITDPLYEQIREKIKDNDECYIYIEKGTNVKKRRLYK